MIQALRSSTSPARGMKYSSAVGMPASSKGATTL